MEKLKVGDKLCEIIHVRFGNSVNYYFSEVVRLTNTRAILNNEKVLINEPKKDSFEYRVVFKEYKDSWSEWHIVTDNDIKGYEQEKQRIKIENWFYNQKFTFEDKGKIFNLLNTQSNEQI